MTVQPAPHARSASEIKAIIEAERTGLPFVLWRDRKDEQRILSLEGHQRATVGRGSSCEVMLADDGAVSRTHAELELIGEEWAASDDGLSRNGTFVNGMHISGRKRLADGDANEVFLSVDAVKSNLRTLFQRFEIGDLPQNQKRTRLVECAFQWGLIAERNL